MTETQQNAIQLAIETLRYYASVCNEDDQDTPAKQTQKVLRAALDAEPAQVQEPVADEENERFSEDVSNFAGSDPEATKHALEAFLTRRAQAQQPAPPADVPLLTPAQIIELAK